MTDVWFLGNGTRTISSADWANAGVIGAQNNTWSPDNGWSLPTNIFTSTQLAILEADNEFLLGQSGPRAILPPQGDSSFSQSGFAYYAEALALQQSHAGELRYPRSNRCCSIGDSIAVGSAATNQALTTGNFFNFLCVLSKGRIINAGIFATGGYTAMQVRDTHLPSVLALDPAPGACIVHCGANDYSISSGTLFDWNTSTSAIIDICTQLLAHGIVPILVAEVAAYVTANATIRANSTKWNEWIRRYAFQNGFPMLDEYAALVQDDGSMLEIYDTGGDETHPSHLGHKAIAQKFIDDGGLSIFPVTGTNNRTSKSNLDLSNMYGSGSVSYGLFDVDTDSNGFANGVFQAIGGGGTGMTASIVAPQVGDKINGKWQQMARATGSTGLTYITQLTPITIGAGLADVGDKIKFSCRVQTENIEAAGTTWGMAFYCLGATDVGQSQNGAATWGVDLDGTLYFERIVPAGCTAMYWASQVDAHSGGVTAKVRIGELTFQNLTKMGLT